VPLFTSGGLGLLILFLVLVLRIWSCLGYINGRQPSQGGETWASRNFASAPILCHKQQPNFAW